MTWARHKRRKEWIAGVFLLAMTLTNVASIPKLAPYLREGYQDFTIFYAAARMVRSGQANTLYNLPAQFREQQQFAPNVSIRKGALPYNHPPFEALLFVPLTFLPYVPAYLVWTALNLIFVAAALLLLRVFVAPASRRQPALSEVEGWGRLGPTTDGKSKEVTIDSLSPAFFALAAAAFVPVARAILQGQDSLLLLLLLVLAFCALEKGNDPTAGAAFAAGLFKFHLVLPLVLLLAARRSKILLGFAPVAALLGAVSVVMVGWSGAVGYVRFLLHLENTGAGGAIVGDMPNLRGIIAAIVGHSGGTSLLPITIAGSSIVLLVAWWRMGTVHDSVPFTLGLATVAAILVSYHTLTHDLSLLLPVVLWLFAVPELESNWPAQTDIVLLLLLYLALLFEPLWPHLNQFAWPLLVLGWMFWKFERRPAAA